MNTRKEYLESLDKATQTAQLFCDDLAAVYRNTETNMEEMFFMELLKQAREIHGKIERVNRELNK